MTDPAVSVVLPVRDGGDYLRLAVESILAQRGVPFELVVVDDGSTDAALAGIAARADPRLRVLRSPGRGLVAALNVGIDAARGRHIARMDADDIALQGRLRHQADLLDRERDVAVVCSAANVIDSQGRHTGRFAAPDVSRPRLRAALLGECAGVPIIHPSVMMRRTAVEAVGGYRDSPIAEDHELWLRMVDGHRFRAMAEPLLAYRHHDHGVSRTRAVEQSMSHLMNAACYRLRVETGVDLIDERPDLYRLLRDRAARDWMPLLTRLAEVRRLRSEMKRGERWTAMMAAARLPAVQWPLLSLAVARRRLLEAQDHVGRRGLALLAGGGL